MRENAAEEVDRDLPGVPVVEISLQNILGDSGSPVRSEMRRESSSRSSPASERIEDLRRGRTWPICSCNSRSSSTEPLSVRLGQTLDVDEGAVAGPPVIFNGDEAHYPVGANVLAEPERNDAIRHNFHSDKSSISQTFITSPLTPSDPCLARSAPAALSIAETPPSEVAEIAALEPS